MIWLDAHLSPRIARWIVEELGIEAQALRDIGLRDAEDEDIFRQARRESVVVSTKDRDFVDLVTRRDPPPSVIWLRCGNTSEDVLKGILEKHLMEALAFVEAGNSIVEIQ